MPAHSCFDFVFVLTLSCSLTNFKYGGRAELAEPAHALTGLLLVRLCLLWHRVSLANTQPQLVHWSIVLERPDSFRDLELGPRGWWEEGVHAAWN